MCVCVCVHGKRNELHLLQLVNWKRLASNGRPKLGLMAALAQGVVLLTYATTKLFVLLLFALGAATVYTTSIYRDLLYTGV